MEIMNYIKVNECIVLLNNIKYVRNNVAKYSENTVVINYLTNSDKEDVVTISCRNKEESIQLIEKINIRLWDIATDARRDRYEQSRK